MKLEIVSIEDSECPPEYLPEVKELSKEIISLPGKFIAKKRVVVKTPREELEHISRRSTELNEIYPITDATSEYAELTPFLNHYGSLPLLSKEELNNDILLYQNFGDLEARNRIVEHNMLLVVNVAKRFKYRRSFSRMDIIQEGCLGLMRSLKTYDVTRGLELSTHATWWIKQAITRSLHSNGSEIRIPEWLKLIRNKAVKTAKKLKRKSDGKVDINALAKKMDLEPEKLARYLQQSDLYTDSLDQPVYNNFSDGTEINLGNLIANNHYRPDHISLAKEALEECHQAIYDLILAVSETITRRSFKTPDLVERNIYIVALRFGIDDGSFELHDPKQIALTISEVYDQDCSRQVVENALKSTWKHLPSQYLHKDQKWLASELRRLNFLIELTETDRTYFVNQLSKGNRLF